MRARSRTPQLSALPEVKREKKKDQVPSWCEPALWWQFKAVDHTLEVTAWKSGRQRCTLSCDPHCGAGVDVPIVSLSDVLDVVQC